MHIKSYQVFVVMALVSAVQLMPISFAQTVPELQSGVIIVQFDSTMQIREKSTKTGLAAFDQMVSEYQIYEIERIYPFLDHVTPTPSIRKNLLALQRTYYVRYHAQVTPQKVSERFSSIQGVVYAEPLIINRLHACKQLRTINPNDSKFESQVDLHQMGFPEAWAEVKSEAGNPKVVIAIVDGGADWEHEDLLANVWTNDDEIPDNGIDDDQNGFIDDIHGVDLSNEDDRNNNPNRQPRVAGVSWHGTATAGIASAVTDNHVGIAGASWNASLMHINASDISGLGIQYGYEGILYAALNGADIINTSWGGIVGEYTKVKFMDQSLELATDMGALIIASAGNHASDIDRIGYYPASHPRVLSVGATEKGTMEITRFSNYGKLVDVFAPGQSIVTTGTDNGYIEVSGTSFSAPLVSGLAALVKTKFSGLSPDGLREKIRVSAMSMDEQNPTYLEQLGRGFVNATSAVQNSYSPGIRMKRWSWKDDDGDQSIASGDVVRIKAIFVNYLADASSVSASIAGIDPYAFLNFTEDQASIGGLSSGDSVEVEFEFRVANNAMPNQRIRLYTRVEADGTEDISGLLSLSVNRSLGIVHHSLSALYTATGGDQWQDNSNWNTTVIPSIEALGQWFGITIREGWLSGLNLQYNNLTGEIPLELTNLTQLRTLLLGGNSMSGPIPRDIHRLSQLEILNLSVNSLSGRIPLELGELAQLKVLELFENSFSGQIPPSLGKLSKLEVLNLEANSLTGQIPRDLGNLLRLEWLGLRDNDLSGKIPYELGALPQLAYIDLAENSFSGNIPTTLGDLSSLKWLVLAENSLSGEIPSELGHLPNLEILDLEDNSLSGPLPIALTALPRLNDLNVSTNHLSGEIPSQFGNLSGLTHLNLSNNNFRGSLPRSLLALDSLEVFTFDGQPLCAPNDEEFQKWIKRIPHVKGHTCGALAFSEHVQDQEFIKGHPIVPVLFPPVTNGIAPIIYWISPDLPNGLRFNAVTRTLTGTPVSTTEMPVVYTYTAMDHNGAVGQFSFKISIQLPVSDEDESLPTVFAVHGNFPNPFQGATRLTFDLPVPAHLMVEVTDISGRKVLRTPEKHMTAGWSQTIEINGESLPAGLYLYRLIAKSFLGRESHAGRFIHVK